MSSFKRLQIRVVKRTAMEKQLRFFFANWMFPTSDSMRIQDGCKGYMESYMASHVSCFMVTWTILKNHLLEVGLTQNWETKALWMLTTVDLFYFYHVWGPVWIEIHWNSIWSRARSHMNFTLRLKIHDHTTWFRRCVGMAFGRLLLGSHNLVVTALSSCVKWPQVFRHYDSLLLSHACLFWGTVFATLKCSAKEIHDLARGPNLGRSSFKGADFWERPVLSIYCMYIWSVVQRVQRWALT
jgi:hypothetical protein